MSVVSFIKAGGRGDYQFREAIFESLDLIGYKFGKQIRNVVIKPNMCFYWDRTTGQTTDPEFVASLVGIIRDQVSPDVNISIVESDASAMRCGKAFRILGYERMARRIKVDLVNLSKDEGEKVNVVAGGHSFRFMLPRTIKEADLKINVPKIKFMAQTRISCSLKNIYGCNPYPNKFRYHTKLDEAIVALNKIMGFSLFILDGIIVVGSHARRLDLVMASQDPVALDTAATQLTGVNPRSIRHIVLASREGLGKNSFIPRGADPKMFARAFPKKRPIEKVMSSAYTVASRIGLLKTDMI